MLTITQDISAPVSYIKAIETQNKQLHEMPISNPITSARRWPAIMGLVDLIIHSTEEYSDPELPAF